MHYCDDVSLRLSEALRTMRARESKMKRTSLATAAAAMAAGSTLLWPAVGRAQAVPKQIHASVKDHLTMRSDGGGVGDFIRQSEAAGEILAETHGPALDSVATFEPAAERGGAVASNATLLFSSRHQVTLGNPEGDVTLVEFFDYNCGFCKRALSDMVALLHDDPRLKIVLKELPVLGPESIEAARVAVAVRMEDPSGKKYLSFHQQLLGGRGPVGKERALMAALDQGLNLAALERDMASDEVRTTIAENLKLASAVGIDGTPGYVVGNNLVLGAVGVTALKARIAAARGHRMN
jgi:protein-disulfide isomerase